MCLCDLIVWSHSICIQNLGSIGPVVSEMQNKGNVCVGVYMCVYVCVLYCIRKRQWHVMPWSHLCVKPSGMSNANVWLCMAVQRCGLIEGGFKQRCDHDNTCIEGGFAIYEQGTYMVTLCRQINTWLMLYSKCYVYEQRERMAVHGSIGKGVTTTIRACYL